GDLSLINDTTYFQLTDDANRPAGAIPGFRVNTILDGGGNAVIPVNPDKINAKVALNGTILAHGFNGGGTFTLHTPSFQFGDQPIEGGTALSLDFFSKTGFANYDIVSYKTALLDNDFDNGLGGYNAVLAYQTVTIGQGETLSLSQSMFSPLLGVDQRAALLGLGSGGDLYSVLDPSIAPEAWDRRAVNLNLGGTIELHIAEGGTLTNDAGGTLAVSKLFNEGTIRMPGGTIRQSAILPGIYTSASAIGVHDLSGAFTIGPDGSIAEGDPNAAGVFGLTNGQLAGQSPIYLLGELDADEGVRLGSGSTTDLSGVSIVNPRAEALGQNVYTPIRDGVVIGGGSLISVAAAQLDGKLFNAGFGTGVYTAQNPVAVRAALQVNAEAGAKLDLSGASDTFVRLDRLQTTPIGASPGYTETAVWSNGGLLMLGNGGSITQANLDAHGGADAASGGTLVILDPTLTQHDTDDATPNSLSADFIGRSGFDTLQALGSLSSVGDVSLRLDRGFFLSSRPYGGLAGQNLNDPALRDAFAPVISSGGRLEIWAPYIRFDSQLQSVTTPFLGALADNSAIFHAGTIDISGAVVFDQSIGTAVLDATNAVRLSGVQPYQLIYGVGDQTVANSLAGQLAVNGDLTIRAGQVYPTTGSSFAITSSALDGTITFERNGPTPATPYSAGGSLLVQAANIVQGGVIQVPLGRLTLGSNTAFERTTGGTTATFAPVTQSVRLTDGSVTSVSAEGLTIPYGVTTDGIEWFFSPTGANRLTAPPEAVLSLGGVDVAMESGATVNVKGGGDLVAYEFVPGTGGSRDVLSQFNNDPFSGNDGYQYPDQRQVYAVVPGLSDQAVAAYDPIYSQD
ncbi:MAG: hypothetical protein ACXWVJ_09585, partial [Caulobacteraceae bacterium]